MELEQALGIARELAACISPFCRRVEIAGSIRRRKPEVKDVEIVAIPQWEECPDPNDLFGERMLPVNKLHQWARSADCPVKWIKPGTPHIVPWKVEPQGRYWRGLWEGNLKLDLFLCEPDNWGAIYLIRTGSAEFSYAVATQAKNQGMPFVNGSLTVDGKPFSTPEERDIFDLLGLEWREPEQRRGWDDVVARSSSEAGQGQLSPMEKAAMERFIWKKGDLEVL